MRNKNPSEIRFALQRDHESQSHRTSINGGDK
ncbi:hypothetical protein J2W17_005902 [Pseudomonas lini]|nr:hypothetical protein [Pseudomonas lini]